MDIQFFEPEETPQPPDKVRIESLEAEPYPDGQRVMVQVHVTPFQERPNLALVLEDNGGTVLTSTNIIEMVEGKVAVTLHLRHKSEQVPYRLFARLAFPEHEIEDEKQISLSLDNS